MYSFGSKIPNFISSYFPFMSEVVRLLNKDGEIYIDRDRFETLIEKWDVPLDSVLKYRIAYEADGVYEIDRRVADFVSFSNNDYALSSPESVYKYYRPLQNLHDSLLAASEHNDIIRYCRDINKELRDFSGALDSSKTRLLKEALSLQEQGDSMTPQERFVRATEIIRFYVEPLKAMAEDSDQSILSLIRMLGNLAITKMQKVIDPNVTEVLHRLRYRSDTTHEDVVIFGKKVIRELMALRKIKKNNAIMGGAILWLENQDTLAPQSIGEAYRIHPHRKEFFFNALEEMEELLRVDIPVILPSEKELDGLRARSLHAFYASEHLRRLDEAMPIENVFRWIYTVLDRDDTLSFENYFSALALMNEYTLTFSQQRDHLEFENYTLDVPIVRAQTKNTQRGTHGII